jgi:predicted RNA binding protein with dsRBD fold (UPF0201 family)
MIYSIDVRVTAPVKDTEVPDRVARAVEALFPTADVETRHGEVRADAHDLDHFRERLREQRILDTARTVFHDGRYGDAFEFDLKKQAAFEDVVNFSVGNPDELGDVHAEVRVREPSVEEFIGYLAPPTDDEGRPLDES